MLYIAVLVGVGSGVAYAFEHQIVEILLKPSNGQDFIYTSPMGGMNFLFTVCLEIGLVVATPMIVYQLLAFLHPLMRDTTHRFLLWASGASGLVAFAGVVFGYFVGLPSALHFLMNQFSTIQVRPLITIQSYVQFVALYLLGYALMFQLPLIVLLINRIKPLGPRTLLKYERHMIIGAIIIAFIMNPSPNLIDQLFVVVPIIISYQFSILLLWYLKRYGRPVELLKTLRTQDTTRQAERTGRELQPLDEQMLEQQPALVAVTEDHVRPVLPAAEPASIQVATVESDEQPIAVVLRNIAAIDTPASKAAQSAAVVTELDADVIPVRIATVPKPKRSAISVATAIEVAHRSSKVEAAPHAIKIPVSDMAEPAPITYTPDSEVERVQVRVIRPGPIDLAHRGFIPSLRSQLIQ